MRPFWYSLLAALGVSVFATGPAFGQQPTKPSTNWRYLAKPAGRSFSRPVMNVLRLSQQKPEEMTEDVDYRGRRQRYGQLRYGSEDSTRVIVVVDERSETEFDLYVDRNRNRTIEPDDLVRGEGRTRQTPLDVEMALGNVARYDERVVLFRRGLTGRTLSVGTVGCAEGKVELDGRTVAVRRVDGDANGFFSNVRDRLWIDVDGDGEWNPVGEQFPYKPVLKIDDGRFAVRADRLGERMKLERIVGVGRLTVRLATQAKGARVETLDVTLAGNDGSAYSLQAEETAELPVGRYALTTITLRIVDQKTGEPWNFVFSRPGSARPKRWYQVRADQELIVDPIGRMRFQLNLADEKIAYRGGEAIPVDPRLYTEDGLLINFSCCGEFDRYSSSEQHNCASLRLVSSGERTLGTASSGFS